MISYGFAGDVLIRAGVVDAEGLVRGLEAQAREAVTLGRAFAVLGLADESAVAAAIAAALHLEYLNGELPDVDRSVVALLPLAFCRKRGVVPLSVEHNTLRVAVIDPLDDSALQDVQFGTGKKAVAVVVTQTWLERLLLRLHPEPVWAAGDDLPEGTRPSGEVEAIAEREFDLADSAQLALGVKLPPVVRLLNLILTDAARAGASDVHIEPHETEVQVRQRVDGLLHDTRIIPSALQDATISRLKIMSGMDIAERRKPQDGRSRLRIDKRRIDLRVSTMPTPFGEKVVIRLLNTERAVMPLDRLAFSDRNLRLIQSFLSHPQGMILVTGPTGSGKTSTLYAALNTLTSSTNNIITLEDPIEMQIPGVNQMQLNARAGVTFASGLRSILRQDPNVILVGEIRDQETANVAFGAAQTGHLLLSTLHTNDATATITRLLDLGIQPFLISSSLLGIVAQRLVRRVCPACTVLQPPSAETIEKIGGAARLPPGGRWSVGRGCAACGQSGAKGRIAIHEVLPVTDEVRNLISRVAAESIIKKTARGAGMRTLLEDGVDKAAQGLTTLDEVLRVVSRSDDEGLPADVSPPVARIAESAGDVASVAPDSGRGRVLVVEDSPTIVSVVKYFLELEGFEVLVAEDGLVGLETARRALPDVVVTDVNMPGMGGVAMVKALRADHRTAKVRILMLTSEASIESETEGLAAGADDYLVKPVEPRRLAARVKALRARSHAGPA